MWKEFKDFIMRGNVIDLAIAVVIGGVFGAVVKSLVDNIIMPPIGLLLGGVDFANLFLVMRQGISLGPYATLADAQAAGAVTLNYGLFINSIITFLVVALAIFFMVKGLNQLYKVRKAPEALAEPTTKACPFCTEEIPIKATRCPRCTSLLEAATD